MAPSPTSTAKYLLIAAVVVLLAADLRFVSSQGASPTPATDCMTALTGIVDCFTYIQNGSTLTKPDPACCPELCNLVSTQPICLCQLAANANQIGIPIDLARAISLPATCKVTFSLSACTAGGSTTVSPPTEGPSADTPPPEIPDAPPPETPDTSASETQASSATPALSTSTSTSPPPRPRGGSPAIIISPVVASLVILAGAFIYGRKRFNSKKPANGIEEGDNDEIIDGEPLEYKFAIIRGATNNFSTENELGRGGFGVVYKGILENGQLVAVKRLSNGSTQGEIEFKNEVILLTKLHHKNLVKIHGYSLYDSERVLIYEFAERGSLDRFIYDSTRDCGINWNVRRKIIEGVAKGLAYLHGDAGYRIIHRDLKPSNILLDGEMNPKIADFGLARLFDCDESYINTIKVAGTPGYMAPEYHFKGHISEKTDVYSFGVLVLEMISGQRNASFKVQGLQEDMLDFAWSSWQEQTIVNMIDPMLRAEKGCDNDIIRCIHIGLLCVQTDPKARPTMATILQMFKSYSITMASPSRPGVFITSSNDSSTVGKVAANDSSTNGASNTLLAWTALALPR